VQVSVMRAILESKWFRASAAVALLLGLYAFVGFRVAPGLIRDQAIAAVRETYGRELQVGAVRVQPFKLQLEVRDLAFPDRDRQAMLSLRRLFVDFELASLWRRAWVFRDLDLEGPAVRAVLRRDGTLNLADLTPQPGPDAAAPDADAGPSALPGLWIESLAIRDGKAEYVELAGRQKPFVRGFSAVGFTLEDFRTTPEGGAFRLAARGGDGEQFDWNGRFALSPQVASEGEFAVAGLKATGVAEFIGDALPFGLSAGTIDLGGRYQLSLGASTELKVQVPRVTLAGLALRARGAGEDWLTIPTLTVSDTVLALPEQSVAIGSIVSTGLEADAWLDPGGSVNLAQLFVRAPTAPESSPAPAASAPPPPPPDPPGSAVRAPGRPWTLRLASFEMLGAGIDFEDRSAAPAKRFRVGSLDLRVRDASLDLERPLPVTLDATINDHAALRVAGTLTPEPLATALDVSLQKARMQILQPYILPLADLTIRSGLLGVEGRLQLEPPGRDGPRLRFAGDVSIDDFGSIDNAMRQEFVSFRGLRLRKLRYAMAPDALDIDLVRLVSPYARVIISREQILNIAAVLDPRGVAAQVDARRRQAAALASESRTDRRRRQQVEKARAAAARKAARQGAVAAASPAPPPPDVGMPIRIRQVRVDGGRMNFSDLSIQPNFAAEVRQLNGTVTGLSSSVRSRATVDLEGNVDEFSPVVIAGTVQPFAFDRFTDIGLKFENIALPVFNPYSGQFAGYNIAKGKLTTDLRYLITDRKLDAQHRIRIDQLEWGEASANKGEATLPVKFATALLKDRDGVINLDVPVTGTLDDPKLRIGPIVWQVIKNLIVKAVTAPFALLGSLFAGAEDAQFVDFAPGDATLEAATAERLAALSKGLVQKPAVSLDVPIGVVAGLDTPALLQQRYLEQRSAVIVAVAGRRAATDAAPPAFESLAPKQQREVLQALLKQIGGPKVEVPPPAEPAEGSSRAEARARAEIAAIEFLDQAARGRVVIGEGDLATLGRARADAIQRALLAGSELEPSRVFLVTDGKVGGQDGKVRFELGLK
jgi:hypothetical protein